MTKFIINPPKYVSIDFSVLNELEISLNDYIFLEVIHHYQQNSNNGWLEFGINNDFVSLHDMYSLVRPRISESLTDFTFALLIKCGLLEAKENGYRVTDKYRQLFNNQ